jgi:hypothetical protein
MKTFKQKLKKTRNIILFTAVGMVLAYTVADIVFGFIGLGASEYMVFQFDATLTQEFFEFWKWVVVTGAGITIAKTAKGKTNSDDDENNTEGIV